MKYSYKILGLFTAAAATLCSCSDFLEKEPMSQITPEKYYSSDAQIETIILDEYPNSMPGHSNYSYGIFGGDNQTDNQVGANADARFTADQWKVPLNDGTWAFNRIYYLNFTLSQVLPRYGEDLAGSQNTISGNLDKVKHLIGELYFLRAKVYYDKLTTFGDFPIITEPLKDDHQILAEASKRYPMNEVGRFIIEDLDKAATLMGSYDMIKTRASRDAALLLKSRVGLYVGSWLQNFKGTAFVPGGEGWPGAKAWPDFKYQAGDIDAEAKWFLQQAMEAGKELGDKMVNTLVANTGTFQQSADEAENPYFNMFCDENMEGYGEIILWRQYAFGIATHNVNVGAGRGNYLVGMTRGYVQNFLMADGTPVYAHGTYADGDGYYMGDKTLTDVRANRDSRLSVFLKDKGQTNVLYELDNTAGTDWTPVEPEPQILNIGDGERGYTTGYALHKGGNFNRKYYANGGGYTGAPIYRGAEALLNYMEACYLATGAVDGTADKYWRALRKRANVDENYTKTIAQTDMNKEAENDWGAYTGGTLVDPTLYNIRRERRCELLSEGFRWNDLRRWRAMDQLISTPYHIEGFHLWNTPMEKWYAEGSLVHSNGTQSIVSSPDRSEYLRPFEKNSTQLCYDGCTFRMAYYMNPIPVKQMMLAADDRQSAENSIIHQNPYWPTEADMSATK
ncbi:MAG: RagB/SusD family nutrient uptake outer membrane protein [Clostridium sp.]|nr:RagB/SusD family nutrient uptake outer membrane protein [Clostridium sp.]